MKANINYASNTASFQANAGGSSQHGAHVERENTLKRKGIQSETLSLLKTPSCFQTNIALLPPMKTAIEFELVASHPNAYPSLIPLDVARIDLSLLGISPLTYFGRARPVTQSKGSDNTTAEARPWPPQSPSPGKTAPTNQNQQVNSSASSATAGNAVLIEAVTSDVSHLVDARLAHVRFRQWTDVRITDTTAAKAISLCLEKDSAWWGLPNVDLFLDDLVSGETRFCSKLLVNSLMTWSLVSSGEKPVNWEDSSRFP